MSDDTTGGKLHIDGDWKAEAAREKERLAEREAEEQRTKPAAPGEPGFLDILNMLGMQAMIGLGGYQGPSGERMPPNPALAKHHIDLLEVLEKKTAGNLTDDETKTLNTLLYELRMQYVQAVSGPMSGAGPVSGGGAAPAGKAPTGPAAS